MCGKRLAVMIRTSIGRLLCKDRRSLRLRSRSRTKPFTTSKSPLTNCGDVLNDHDLAEAITARVLEKGRLIR
jgi:hypothetical protein